MDNIVIHVDGHVPRQYGNSVLELQAAAGEAVAVNKLTNLNRSLLGAAALFS